MDKKGEDKYRINVLPLATCPSPDGAPVDVDSLMTPVILLANSSAVVVLLYLVGVGGVVVGVVIGVVVGVVGCVVVGVVVGIVVDVVVDFVDGVVVGVVVGGVVNVVVGVVVGVVVVGVDAVVILAAFKHITYSK